MLWKHHPVGNMQSLARAETPGFWVGFAQSQKSCHWNVTQHSNGPGKDHHKSKEMNAQAGNCLKSKLPTWWAIKNIKNIRHCPMNRGVGLKNTWPRCLDWNWPRSYMITVPIVASLKIMWSTIQRQQVAHTFASKTHFALPQQRYKNPVVSRIFCPPEETLTQQGLDLRWAMMAFSSQHKWEEPEAANTCISEKRSLWLRGPIKAHRSMGPLHIPT